MAVYLLFGPWHHGPDLCAPPPGFPQGLSFQMTGPREPWGTQGTPQGTPQGTLGTLGPCVRTIPRDPGMGRGYTCGPSRVGGMSHQASKFGLVPFGSFGWVQARGGRERRKEEVRLFQIIGLVAAAAFLCHLKRQSVGMGPNARIPPTHPRVPKGT